MSVAGAKPKPTHLKVLNGRGAGKDSAGRKIKTPPAFVRKAPSPPTWMSAEARAEWRRVVPELERLKLIKQAMRGGLAVYCETWDLFVRSTKEIHDNGLVVENRSVKKDGTESVWFTANPAVAVQRNAAASLRQWCSEFGLTPTSEGRLSVPDEVETEDDLLD